MGIYSEKSIPRWAGVIILIAAFIAIYQPWLLGDRELFRLEGLYAVSATEFDPSMPMVTAHGVAIQNVFPFFPAMASVFQKVLGMPMEFSLRFLAVLMMAATAVIVYFAAASERSYRAGLVAAAMYIGTFLALEKGIEGYPTTTNAFFLLSAQLLFFQFGIRQTNWNAAWIVGSALLAMGFFTGGFLIILYFVFPMFFFRRPLSVKSKFRKPGFPVGVALLAAAVLVWGAPFWLMSHRVPFQYLGWADSTLWDYISEVLLFPVMLPVRLLPWALIAWMPFCVALQALDTTPIFSRYLRTLTFATLALLWLLPQGEPREIFYLLGPLSILVGINYELGIRRYGIKVRKLLVFCEYFTVGLALAVGGICFAPERWLSWFISLNNTLDFRLAPEFRLTALVAVAVLLSLTVFLHYSRKTQPVWLILLTTTAAAGIFYGIVMHPYRAQEEVKREFGTTIRRALDGQPGGTLYKSNILDLYGELFYSGAKVVKLQSLEELPEDQETVYLISTEFPQYPDRSWSNLLPPDYSYRNHRLSLWKGVKRERKAQPAPLI